jgi:hypothetical protein
MAAGLTLTRSGQPGPQGPPGYGPTIAKITADQTFLVTALADVTSLSFPVTTGGYYEFEFAVIYRTGLSTAGIRLGLTFPAITRFAAAVDIHGIAAASASEMFTGIITTSGGSVVSAAVAATNTDYPAWVHGIIVPSADGTLQLRAAPEVAATLTIRQGSNARLWTVP